MCRGRESGRREPRRPRGSPPGATGLTTGPMRPGPEGLRSAAGARRAAAEGRSARRGGRPRREVRSPRLGGKQRTEPGPGRARLVRAPPPPGRSPHRAGSGVRPRPLTKMRLKRLLSLGGSCTFGIAAGGEDGCPGAAFRGGGHRGGPLLRVGQRAMGQFMAWSWGRAGRWAGRWAGLAVEGERDPDWTRAAPALRTGERRRLPRAARWQPEPVPSSGAVCACAGRPAARGGGGLRAAGTAACRVSGRFCHRPLGAPPKSLIVLC